ncbi:iron(III) transport system ATP-binding protein [Anaerobranca californiensis DSM 14826]|jgi:iron(III) transport system ATP-binding protein|uniref:ABC-type quaternary amine transporter n=1 Tax=Anaerobranca californiensis DSM 14826 TaxID=1120989 RepID=A0A1M6NYE6_9FIRM|nr:ABC transporter ATP-binding protein [Anaerobranca californiensis]SHK00658.1 iron(III) transport system ATP-binding protein [Anaerobranca californiensis DSM 14826]
MNDIVIKNLTKRYERGQKPALNNFSLNIEKGEIVTLLGPSGCGKTTTLRLLAGFERGDGGSIEIGGKVVFDDNTWIPPEQRNIGMVFQDYALFPHLNVENNIGFGYKGKDKKQRVKEVLELVNLTGYEKRYPHQLSGGQQQRVALARALARRPVVVLLDEPFSNLDADLRICMRVEIKRILKESGTTAVFVSHDQKDALAISDKVVVIKDGEIQQVGTPREIYQYPENSFVANFVGQTNIIDGTMGENNTVITPFANIKCYHTHDILPGTKVKISIRPDSFEVCPEGELEGTLIFTVYGGDTIDGVLQITNGIYKQNIQIHIHPEKDYKIGDKLKVKILPHFVAVLQD